MNHLLHGVLSNIGNVHKDSCVRHSGLGGHICQYSWRAAACNTTGSSVKRWHAD